MSRPLFWRQLIMGVLLVLTCTILPDSNCANGATAPDSNEQGPELSRPPSFLVRFFDGKTKVFNSYNAVNDKEWNCSDKNLSATIERVTNDEWKLKIDTKDVPIKEVSFPWFEKKIALNSNQADDIIYYPYLLGVSMKPELRGEWEWWGVDYPGSSFAPLVIIADDTDAIMVAATNWPPKKVKPVYSLRRVSMLYSEKIVPHDSSTYMAKIVKVSGDASKGNYPWHRVLDNYKAWLRDKMTQEGLYPVIVPQWMQKVDGFINLQLENMGKFDVSAIYKKWNKWSSIFPWIQFWGQMSEGYPHPDFGCCIDKQQMHPRYIPDLITFARNITGLKEFEGHVGYYSRPKPDTVLVDSGAPANNVRLDFLLQWLHRNKELYHANVFYLDTVGGRYMGDPLRVAKLFKGVFPENTFIEFPVDIYPTAFLASGSLGGSIRGYKKKGRDEDDLAGGPTMLPFPRFGRYLLDDRIIFLGQSNGDYKFWGKSANYWTERRAFLLGAKFDVVSPQNDYATPNTFNYALNLAITERKRVKWWDRNPVYKDVNGIFNIPKSIAVRRFTDASGKNLFVVDNWQQIPGLKINFRDKIVEIPARRLSIIDLN